MLLAWIQAGSMAASVAQVHVSYVVSSDMRSSQNIGSEDDVDVLSTWSSAQDPTQTLRPDQTTANYKLQFSFVSLQITLLHSNMHLS